MLHIIATPIGNLADISQRAREALAAADVIAAEDTRRTWTLLSALNIPRPQMISYRQGLEEAAGKKILSLLAAGKNVALCSDGGYPAISDPGYRLIALAVENNINFDVIPGPCAATVALVASGLPTSSFVFKGFPPRKDGQRAEFFAAERDAPHTIVIYESPFRIGATLQSALEILGDRRAAVCFELTKQHERILRGWLSELAAELSGTQRGESVIVIAGNHAKFIRANIDPTTSREDA